MSSLARFASPSAGYATAINLLDYLPAGPNGSTNNAGVFTSALAAAAAGPRRLFVPRQANPWIIGTSVTVPNGVEIFGDGWGPPNASYSTIKLANGLNGFAFTMSTSGADGNRVVVRDLQIDGNCANQSSGGIFLAYNPVQSEFSSVHFHHAYDVALHIYGQQGSGPYGHHVRVVNSLFDNSGASAGNGQAIRIQSADEVTITGCDFENNGGSGSEPYHIKDWSGLNNIENNVFVGGKEGIRLQDCTGSRVIGNMFDGLNADNVSASGYSHIIAGNFFSGVGNTITTNTYRHLHINNGGNHTVTGNTFWSGSTTNGLRAIISHDTTASNSTITGNTLRTTATIGSGGVIDYHGGSASAQSVRLVGNVGFTDALPVGSLATTGSASSSTFLRGDGAWTSVTGSSPVIEASASGVTFNGVTDTRTSLNTLLAGLSDGATVAFPPGATAILSANVQIPSGVDNITILGRGATLKLSGSAANAAYVLDLIGSGATICDLTIDSSNVTNSTGIRINGNGHTIRGCTFKNSVAGGVYVEGASSDLAVTDNTFGEGYGLLVKDDSTASGLLIANNRFTGSTHGDAIEINTPASASTGAHDITIIGNVITDYTDTTSATGIGIGVANASNVAITGNTILNTKLDGIHIEDSCVGITISGNSIKGTGRSGIAVNVGAGTVPPKGWTISGNAVVGCGTASGDGGIAIEGIVSVRNGTITGNSVRNCGRSGYSYYSGIFLGYQSKDIVCTGNYVSGTIGTIGAGIGWNTGEAFTVTGNICQDRGGSTQDYGIRVEGDQVNVVISSNILTQNATAAIDETNIGSSGTSTYYKYLNMPNTVNRTPA